MKIDTERIIPVTRLQKELTKQIQEVSEKGNPLYVFKNNELEAVVVSADEYEQLAEMREFIEYVEVAAVIEKRLASYDRKNNISWDRLRSRT